MKKILNKRLELISAFIKDNEQIIDIGCDHGLLGIYLFLNRKNIRMVSSDVNTGPLSKAKENLIKYHLEDKIELRLGNGLEVMDKDITTVVISGMGAINITNILERINDYPKVSKLILSPNNDFPLLRKNLQQKNWQIVNEEIVLENNKYYLVSIYEKGYKKTNNFFGKLDLNNKIVKEYYQDLYDKNKKILHQLSFINKLKNISLIKENILIKNKCL